MKISDNPMRVWSGLRRDQGHDALKLVGREAVEEEMRDDEIECRRWWLPIQDIGVDEGHEEIYKTAPGKLLVRLSDHR